MKQKLWNRLWQAKCFSDNSTHSDKSSSLAMPCCCALERTSWCGNQIWLDMFPPVSTALPEEKQLGKMHAWILNLSLSLFFFCCGWVWLLSLVRVLNTIGFDRAVEVTSNESRKVLTRQPDETIPWSYLPFAALACAHCFASHSLRLTFQVKDWSVESPTLTMELASKYLGTRSKAGLGATSGRPRGKFATNVRV